MKVQIAGPLTCQWALRARDGSPLAGTAATAAGPHAGGAGTGDVVKRLYAGTILRAQHGDKVRVIDGPFVNFQGVVEDTNPERGRMKVVVPVFGRPTPVELEYYQVERL